MDTWGIRSSKPIRTGYMFDTEWKYGPEASDQPKGLFGLHFFLAEEEDDETR